MEHLTEGTPKSESPNDVIPPLTCTHSPANSPPKDILTHIHAPTHTNNYKILEAKKQIKSRCKQKKFQSHKQPSYKSLFSKEVEDY